MARRNRFLAATCALSIAIGDTTPILAQAVSPNRSAAKASQASTRTAHSEDSRFTRADFEQCQTTDEAAFRTAIKQITLDALRKGTGSIDYRAIVDDQWREAGLNQIVDARVDAATAQIRDETGWSELLKSLAFRKQAQELARATAERTYRSGEMKLALEGLATKVGKEIGRSIVLTTADAAAPAQQCLRAYLGPRYGSTVARSVNQDAGSAFEIDPKASQASVSSGAVLLETSSGISGAVLLLVRRQMARMARRIGQRMVGSILGRLVSVVAGGVGVVLIAKEFWELRHGVLPIVADEMKSSSSKAKVREELAKSIKKQIADHLDELAARTADKIVDIWHDFRRAHQKVVQLADQDASFKTFLDTVAPTGLPRLSELVALILEKEGSGAVSQRLQNGTLHRALNKMPEAGMQIAREQRSLSTALGWMALSGDQLEKVVKYDLHKHAKPDAFSQSSLASVLALDDRIAIAKIGAMNQPARQVLMELDRPRLVNLSRTLSEEELTSLASYLTSLAPNAGQRILRLVADNPSRMTSLQGSGVRQAIMTSKDQNAAVGMMMSESPIFDIPELIHHVELVWDGRVKPLLLWQRHPTAVITGTVMVLIILLMLKSLLFGRRRSRKSRSA